MTWRERLREWWGGTSYYEPHKHPSMPQRIFPPHQGQPDRGHVMRLNDDERRLVENHRADKSARESLAQEIAERRAAGEGAGKKFVNPL